MLDAVEMVAKVLDVLEVTKSSLELQLEDAVTLDEIDEADVGVLSSSRTDRNAVVLRGWMSGVRKYSSSSSSSDGRPLKWDKSSSTVRQFGPSSSSRLFVCRRTREGRSRLADL